MQSQICGILLMHGAAQPANAEQQHWAAMMMVTGRVRLMTPLLAS